jgi:hypothetical protein
VNVTPTRQPTCIRLCSPVLIRIVPYGVVEVATIARSVRERGSQSQQIRDALQPPSRVIGNVVVRPDGSVTCVIFSGLAVKPLPGRPHR